MKLSKKENRLRRARKGRAKIHELEVNRLSVQRTPGHIYAHIIAPDGGTVLATGSGSTQSDFTLIQMPTGDYGGIYFSGWDTNQGVIRLFKLLLAVGNTSIFILMIPCLEHIARWIKNLARVNFAMEQARLLSRLQVS